MTSLRWFLVIGFIGILSLLTSLGVSVNLFGKSQAQTSVTGSNEVAPLSNQGSDLPGDQIDPLNREVKEIPPPPNEAFIETPIGEGSTAPVANDTLNASEATESELEVPRLDSLPPLPESAYKYQQEGRRDPFEPFRRVKAAMIGAAGGGQAGELSALERWEIDKIKIIAVLWDTQNPRAVVMTPDAATHTVAKGTKIGRNFGVIKDIREGEIIVAEKIFVDGQSKTEIQVSELNEFRRTCRRGLHKIILLGVFTSLILSCASNQSQEDLSLDASSEESSGVAAGEDEFSVEDEFEETEVAEATEAVETAEADDFSEESLNDDLAPAESQENALAEEIPAEEAPPELEIVEDDFAVEETAPPAPAVIEEPIIANTEEPIPLSEQAPVVEANRKPIEITGVNYKANEQGGSVVIDASEPLSYYTRYNSDLNQFVIEVDNAILPARLKRSLNTKDIKGAIGAVDAYQNSGSKIARFVIQMRPGASEPVVQTAVNSLVIVANGIDQKEAASEGAIVDAGPADVLPISKLEEYLVGNTKFYGKKISIEMNNMDVREALQFIMDESGMNMVISDKVDGKVSLKLRQVPWDQALVIVMKAKSLGYNRQGNVLRIATLDELRREEDEALKLLADRQKLETLKVRMFPVSYAKVDDLEKKLKEFMSERGKVVSDIRTNAIVVTETEENLVRVSKLIESLDIRPPQVLIEGKIVEAKESFTRAVGVSWTTVGSDIKIGQTRRGPVNLRPGVGVNTSYNTQGASLLLNLNVGTLDIFGNLTAALALREFEEKVKVISSPRILVLTNEPAIISQVQEVPVRQVTQNGTATQETFTFKPLALKMEVTPQVTTDGSIIMKVNVQRQIRGADIGTGQGANFSVDSREANTRVIVQNGQTAVIGGIFNSEMTSAEDGVPWLRELPFVGGLFRTNSKQSSKTELLVFVTPRIMSSGTGQNSTAPAM